MTGRDSGEGPASRAAGLDSIGAQSPVLRMLGGAGADTDDTPGMVCTPDGICDAPAAETDDALDASTPPQK